DRRTRGIGGGAQGAIDVVRVRQVAGPPEIDQQMRAGKLHAVLLDEVILLDLRLLGVDPASPLSVGRNLVAARKFRDHPQWVECVHRVPLPTSRRPVGPYARKPARALRPLGPRRRDMMAKTSWRKPLFALRGDMGRTDLCAWRWASISLPWQPACPLPQARPRAGHPPPSVAGPAWNGPVRR